jgi:hypothetical protein
VKSRTVTGIAMAAALLGSAAASAHHSFAAFFDSNKVVTIKGTVKAYAFKNPHGTITLDAQANGGRMQEWRVETNAPVVLMRRGWTRNSLKPGDKVTITGWMSRDGKSYIRLQKAVHADGRAIGVPFTQGED